jgi:uncharacterized membrane protein
VPFTLSHPAAAWLFRGTPLPVAAMVAGSMSPDVPVFLRDFGRPYGFTHSLTGAVTVDLAMALVALAVWFSWLRDPLVDLAPAAVRDRLPARARYSRQQWLLAVPASVLGSLTHVVWDAFTHGGRWGADRIAWLRDDQGSHAGSTWAQYLSTVIGAIICLAWAVIYLRSRQPTPRPPRVPVLRAAVPVLAGAVALAAVAFGVTYDGGPLRKAALGAVVATMLGLTAILLLASLWHLLARTSRR